MSQRLHRRGARNALALLLRALALLLVAVIPASVFYCASVAETAPGESGGIIFLVVPVLLLAGFLFWLAAKIAPR